MANTALKLSKKKLVEGLSDLSFKEIKEIMDSLIRKKLFTPPKARTLYKQASQITKGGAMYCVFFHSCPLPRPIFPASALSNFYIKHRQS